MITDEGKEMINKIAKKFGLRVSKKEFIFGIDERKKLTKKRFDEIFKNQFKYNNVLNKDLWCSKCNSRVHKLQRTGDYQVYVCDCREYAYNVLLVDSKGNNLFRIEEDMKTFGWFLR
jgi:hypothetical protein